MCPSQADPAQLELFGLSQLELELARYTLPGGVVILLSCKVPQHTSHVVQKSIPILNNLFSSEQKSYLLVFFIKDEQNVVLVSAHPPPKICTKKLLSVNT